LSVARGDERMTEPPGPMREPRLTLTFAAFDVAASSTTLKDTVSFSAPNVRMQVPSQTLFMTMLACPVARSSSCVTLSPPSFAHTAVMDVLLEVPLVSAAQGSPASPPETTAPSDVAPSRGILSLPGPPSSDAWSPPEPPQDAPEVTTANDAQSVANAASAPPTRNR
jgi:hypothetical protein